eukprot:Skav236390  [mRNA]  locus=scaffold29:161963:163115:- [translate_table: standard]
MSSVSADKTGASGLARRLLYRDLSGRSAAESLVLQKLKDTQILQMQFMLCLAQDLGVRAHSGGSWTSTERTASPAADRIKKLESEREKEGGKRMRRKVRLAE